MRYFKDNNLIIRSMIKSDIEDIVNGFKEQNWYKPYEIITEYYNQQESNEKWIIVAEVDGYVAGYATLLTCANDGPFANKGIPQIVDFNVFIKYQRQGIGNKIMNIVESIAKEISDHVTLSVGLHSGYGSAQRIYIKRGYIPDGSGVWYKNSQLEQYAQCENDDDLVLHLIKSLKENDKNKALKG